MLEGAKVVIELTDLDELRTYKDAYYEIMGLISSMTILDIDEYKEELKKVITDTKYGSCSDKEYELLIKKITSYIKIIISKNQLKTLIYRYGAYGKGEEVSNILESFQEVGSAPEIIIQ